MTKSKNIVKQKISKTKKKAGKKDPEQIISEIEEETRVLKGIVSRFSKPLSKEENK